MITIVIQYGETVKDMCQLYEINRSVMLFTEVSAVQLLRRLLLCIGAFEFDRFTVNGIGNYIRKYAVMNRFYHGI